MIDPTVIRQSREAIYAANESGVITDATYSRLDTALVNNPDALKTDNAAKLVFQSVKAWASVPEYKSALTVLLTYLGATAPATTPVPVPPPAPAPTPVPAPSPTTGTLTPLTAGEQGALYVALENGVRAGILPRPFIDKIADDAVQNIYAYADPTTVNGVKQWYYGGASTSDRNAISPYLAIIDQRDANGVPYAPGDPRIQKVSGASIPTGPVTTPPPPLPTNPNDQVFGGNVTVLGKLAVGGAPRDAQAQIQIIGTGSGEITVFANTQRANPQNQTSDDVITFAGSWEGAAAIEIGTYRKGDGTTVWPNPARKRTRVNVDSAGRFGISQERYGRGDSQAQIFTLGIDHDNKTLIIDLMQGGWKLKAGTHAVTNDGAPIEKVLAP